jgi:hypothetical protein
MIKKAFSKKKFQYTMRNFIAGQLGRLMRARLSAPRSEHGCKQKMTRRLVSKQAIYFVSSSR